MDITGDLSCSSSIDSDKALVTGWGPDATMAPVAAQGTQISTGQQQNGPQASTWFQMTGQTPGIRRALSGNWSHGYHP